MWCAVTGDFNVNLLRRENEWLVFFLDAEPPPFGRHTANYKQQHLFGYCVRKGCLVMGAMPAIVNLIQRRQDFCNARRVNYAGFIFTCVSIIILHFLPFDLAHN